MPDWKKDIAIVCSVVVTIGSIVGLAFIFPMSPRPDIRIFNPGVIVDEMEGGQPGKQYRLDCRGKTYRIVLADSEMMYDGELDAQMVKAAESGHAVAVFGCVGTRNFEKYLYVTKINIGQSKYKSHD